MSIYGTEKLGNADAVAQAIADSATPMSFAIIEDKAKQLGVLPSVLLTRIQKIRNAKARKDK